jgi:hypothetical protein
MMHTNVYAVLRDPTIVDVVLECAKSCQLTAALFFLWCEMHAHTMTDIQVKVVKV